jgi:predicted cupin superfamily sugar epimerase
VSSRPPLAVQLGLQPHPEGGWFRETWRSEVSFTPAGYQGQRCAATAIYFLLHPGERSRWHVVRSDEIWLWGPASRVRLGGDLGAGQQPQILVPGGTWQAAEPASDEPVLVSCVVAPGFDFADFRLA